MGQSWLDQHANSVCAKENGGGVQMVWSRAHKQVASLWVTSEFCSETGAATVDEMDFDLFVFLKAL